MIRAAIVGMGWWGQTLVGSVQGKSDAIRFVAGQTRSPDKVADFCRDKALTLHGDFAAVLADPQVDAVVLATPHTMHQEQVKRAAAAGKHVFVEKPIAFDAPSARAVVDTNAASIPMSSNCDDVFATAASARSCIAKWKRPRPPVSPCRRAPGGSTRSKRLPAR
jgi:hypothetical protein